ncbi:hypothetical protein JVX90_00065 [Gordonia sp. PDNC005]|uniref:hypothetical protein n=1 Tax=Gordonia sp. PDNC005 TaxID=2811424 RepID=UPI001963CD29|nr:hypothetical protein [Gordonia sp. PDNC005]QRY62707.1 hypothetical protein JVX90_00065 [Gordonia sp. PDNC005]
MATITDLNSAQRALREAELLEVLDELSTGRIEPDDPRLDQTYSVDGTIEKALRNWTYDDIASAYDRLNSDHDPEDGDLIFYAEPTTIGRFTIGMGEVYGGDGSARIGICGPVGDGGEDADKRAALYLTGEEAHEIGGLLRGMIIDTRGGVEA